MLVASLDGVREPAWTARRGAGHRCPVCWQPVVLRRGAKVQPHFAHRPGADCRHGVGESERHRAMKRSLITWLGRGFDIDFEVEVVRGRRADALVRTPRGNRFVAEMQDSPLPALELLYRTIDYNRDDIPVLWVFSDSRLASRRSDGQVRVPDEIRFVGDDAGGVWVSDCHGGLAWAELKPVAERTSEWVEEGELRSSSYKPKTLRWIETYDAQPHPRHVPSRWRLMPVRTRLRELELDLISFVWTDGHRQHSIRGPLRISSGR